MQDFDPQQMRQHALDASKLLKSLAHPVRLMVLCSLIDQEKSVGQLQQISQVSQSVLSQHLAVLRQQKLVKTRREAQVIYYQIAANDGIKIIETLHQIYCQPSPDKETE
jgi:DNA-binding transcriptional ArsR family regulator